MPALQHPAITLKPPPLNPEPTWRLETCSSLMSAGRRSPDLMLTMSPGTSWSASRVMRLPSLNTLAVDSSSRQQQDTTTTGSRHQHARCDAMNCCALLAAVLPLLCAWVPAAEGFSTSAVPGPVPHKWRSQDSGCCCCRLLSFCLLLCCC